MKTSKPILLLVAAFLCMSVIVQGQVVNGASDGTQIANRDNEFICQPDAVFSQVYPTYDQAWFGDASISYSRTGDDYTATGSFTTMRFWGSNFWGCTVDPTIDFTIRFYQRDPNNPTIPGAEVYSFTKTVTPQLMGIFAWGNSEIFQIDFDFGETITLLDGWVSVTRINSADACTFGLYCLESVGNSVQYEEGIGWLQTDSANFFCLGNGAATPVSPYALLIGMALIATTIIIRYRRA